jgi:hypothetical protein
MARKIAAPAETLRRLALPTAREAVNQDEKGNTHNAESCREAAEAAYDAAAGQSSNFVSIERKHAGTIMAFAKPSSYKDGLRKIMNNYDFGQ